jgi:hypothetical protein
MTKSPSGYGWRYWLVFWSMVIWVLVVKAGFVWHQLWLAALGAFLFFGCAIWCYDFLRRWERERKGCHDA